jgi:hypothetical protein
MLHKESKLPDKEYKAVLLNPWLVLICVFVPCTLGNYLGSSLNNFVQAEQVKNYGYVKK